MAEPKPYTVGEINRLIKDLIEDSGLVTNVQVIGEVSNFKRYPSGHCYFTLKDATGVLKCVMFQFRAVNLRKLPANGETVVAVGRIGVYERDGVYQLYVDVLLPQGKGGLMEAYEKLKAKLEAEGLFAPQRKRELPVHPARVGIITSPAGAAVRDIITVSRRRNPGIKLLLYPVKVQGEGAAKEIARAIKFMNRHQLADVLIVGRGGGSIEDLWAFNEEVVVRAVAASAIPVISSVGHETDFTLADFAADKRAATPSQAAELAVPDQAALKRQVLTLQDRAAAALKRQLRQKEQQCLRLTGAGVLHNSGALFALPAERLDKAMFRLQSHIQSTLNAPETKVRELRLRLQGRMQNCLNAPENQLRELRLRLHNQLGRGFSAPETRVERLQLKLRQELQVRLQEADHGLALWAARLNAVSPLAVLGRGYSLTRGQDGKALTSTDQVRWGEELVTRLQDGEVVSVVQQITKTDLEKPEPEKV
jgi:exodeoxyribonuclease VII large subunit